MIEKEIFDLLREICPDFEEYHFLKTDLYKGKITGGYNLYYKKGKDGKEGMITGKRTRKSLDWISFRRTL